MITKIEIKNTATYGSDPQIIQNLKKINCFYGSNGSGKTTISRVINKPDNYSDCNIIWENNNKLEAFVYNSDFIEANFTPSSKLKGVFTLGENAANVQKEIDDKKTQLAEIKKALLNLDIQLNGSEKDSIEGAVKERDRIEGEYTNKLWDKTKSYRSIFAKSLAGTGLNDRVKFRQNIQDQENNNKSSLQLNDVLIEKEDILYKQELSLETKIDKCSNDILSIEACPFLSKIIVGKDDVDIAKLIKELNNSDWVHKGVSFLEKSDGLCPFCQQELPSSFAGALNDYFDKEFLESITELQNIKTKYQFYGEVIKNKLAELSNKDQKFVNKPILEDKTKLFESLYDKNILLLDAKIKEPARVIELDTLRSLLEEIYALIETANTKIEENNKIFNNSTDEKLKLKGEVWRFILNEISDIASNYSDKISPVIRKVDSLQEVIKSKLREKSIIEAEIQTLEKQTTNIQTTCDDINKILKSFNFQSFKLQATTDNYYEIVRDDGSGAINTLSEGEKRFLTFLYFYNLIKGSLSSTNISTDRIVVIDDPISSLDSEILFIVSALIRALAKEIIKESHIKQLFILTHNIFFYKEISYTNKSFHQSNLFYAIIRKKDKNSLIEIHEDNPVKTSYEMLWEEIKSEQRNNATIQNVMRRILENHFKLFGNTPIDKIEDEFELPDEKCLCRSLCAWIHGGSHNIPDDLYYIGHDDEQIDKFLKIFKDIFDKSGHISHYNIMMGIDNEN